MRKDRMAKYLISRSVNEIRLHERKCGHNKIHKPIICVEDQICECYFHMLIGIVRHSQFNVHMTMV